MRVGSAGVVGIAAERRFEELFQVELPGAELFEGGRGEFGLVVA